MTARLLRCVDAVWYGARWWLDLVAAHETPRHRLDRRSVRSAPSR